MKNLRKIEKPLSNNWHNFTGEDELKIAKAIFEIGAKIVYLTGDIDNRWYHTAIEYKNKYYWLVKDKTKKSLKYLGDLEPNHYQRKILEKINTPKLFNSRTNNLLDWINYVNEYEKQLIKLKEEETREKNYQKAKFEELLKALKEQKYEIRHYSEKQFNAKKDILDIDVFLDDNCIRVKHCLNHLDSDELLSYLNHQNK